VHKQTILVPVYQNQTNESSPTEQIVHVRLSP